MKRDKELIRRLKWICGVSVLLMLLLFSAIGNAISQGMERDVP
jgi:hypothetical protein